MNLLLRWNPGDSIRWATLLAEDTDDVVLWISGVPLLRMRQTEGRWTFKILGQDYESAEEAADAAERWLYDLLGLSDRWLDARKLETLREYVDFLTIRDDEPTALDRIMSVFEQRLEAAAKRGTYGPRE